VVLHQVPTLFFVSSVRDLVLSTPATMAGVIFTPLVGGIMANYFTIGSNIMLQSFAVQNVYFVNLEV